jgi:hypothetical protein
MEVKIGSIVGNWEIISERYKKDNIWYNDCQCICGTIRPVRNWWLTHSKTFGCGCSNTKGRFKSKCVGELSSSYFTSFKFSRKSKNIYFSEEITLDYLWELFLKQDRKCAISGVDILLNPRWAKQNRGKQTKIIQTASIDRINNSLGYTKDNIQWVHKDINYMRGGLPLEIFIAFCKEVYLFNIDNTYILNLNTKRQYFGGK